MARNRLRARLTHFYNMFIAPPKQWQFPKKSQILIYDARGAELLRCYMNEYRVEIMSVHGECVNIPCLLRAMFALKFWRGNLVRAYIEAFIRTVSPRVIVTFIDNDINFYTVSGFYPEAQTIFVQNGVRGGPGDVFASLVPSDKYHVDYMLVFNNSVGRLYQKYISGQSIALGSLQNNAFRASLDYPKGNHVLFISQYRHKPEIGTAFIVGMDGSKIYWEQFYASEIQALKFLNKWCSTNNKVLRIAGCMLNSDGREQAFFTEHLKSCEWEYIPRTNSLSSYELVELADIVVFIDSSLGAESIGRGKKTAGFSCRSTVLKDVSMKFGWPASMSDNGPFWTNDADDAQFLRVMDYLNNVDDREWERIRKIYVAELMEFDPDNTQFQALLARLVSKSVDLVH